MDNSILQHDELVVKGYGAVTERWAGHKRDSQIMAARMLQLGPEYQGRGLRMMACAETLTYYYCRSCESWHVGRASLCRDRMCPTCQWRLAMQRYAAMQRVVQALLPRGYNWGLITLTVPNVWPDKLSYALDAMMDNWHRMSRRKSLRSAAGWARGLELTYNAAYGQVHPHMHILACWPSICGDYASMMAEDWHRTCRKYGLETSINAQHAVRLTATDGDMTHAILETYKYSVKGSDLLAMPMSTLRDVARAWAGRRLMATGGVVKSCLGAAADQLDAPTDESISACRSCGSTDLDWMIARWSMGEQCYRQIALSSADAPPMETKL